jgi:transcriptional regulator GlxA family with amidase domain
MRRIAVLAFDRAQSLDVFGPIEVFDAATELGGDGYRIELVAPGDGVLRLSNGVRVLAEPLPDRPRRVDTLIVAGGYGTRAAIRDQDTVAWVRAAVPRASRVASVCTGAFLLAAAGALDGRRAVTHWGWCDALARGFPAVTVDPDPIFIRDGNVWTSAGVTAGMDLALALVEADLGREAALEVARRLVLFMKRPGGQSQFSAGLAAQAAVHPPLRDLQDWLPDHLAEDLSVTALARRAHMSERSFARAFRREVGMTPAAYVESLRVERARALLEDGEPSLEAVARAVGLSSAEVMRRAFHRKLGVGPAAYRERFRALVA